MGSPVSQRPSLRLRLILTSSTALMPTLTPTEPMEPMDMEPTLMPIMACTTARGPLRLSQRLMLMLTMVSMVTDWATMVWATDTDTPTPIVPTTMARGPLMPSPPLLPSLLPMLMPTTATTVMVPGPTTGTDWDTEDTDWDTEATTGDKFSASEVQSRSSKRTSLLVI